MVIDFLIFFGVYMLGYFTCFFYFHSKTIGTILIVEQENEETALMLEVKKGCTDQIKPGNIVTLAVNTASIMQK